jgi:psp operon transcriptional activator
MADLPAPMGESSVFLAHLDHLSRVAPLDRPVLIIGERGTGKELSAARVHVLSPRWSGPLIKFNCAALPESLLEAELFGVEPGAFTGAVKRRLGRFELADGGTLFLDEIANAGLAVQEKILRVTEYGEFERLGGAETIAVSVRVVAATNRDLPAEAAAGRFREDLLDRARSASSRTWRSAPWPIGRTRPRRSTASRSIRLNRRFARSPRRACP